MTTKFHPEKTPKSATPPNVKPTSGGVHPLLIGLAVSALATGASFALPDSYASAGVASVFLGATYLLCLRVGHPIAPSASGLSLGGLMEQASLSVGRLSKETLRAFFIATLVALLILPPFWWGFLHWYDPPSPFDLERAFEWDGESSPTKWLFEMALWHLVGVALAEEAFFRGYLQSALDRRWRAKLELGPIVLSSSIIAVSLLFALGHFATEPHPSRLAVFFPSLLFGIVRQRTGGIGAAVFLHAECNLFSQWLGQGYGLYSGF